MGHPLLHPSGKAQSSFSLVKPFQASTPTMRNHRGYLWAMCQSPQGKIPNSPLYRLETVAPSMVNALKQKCGPLKSVLVTCDSAHLAIADLAKRFFFRIFQTGNKETKAVPLWQWGYKMYKVGATGSYVSYFVEESGLREWCQHTKKDIWRVILGSVLSSWSPAVLELPKVTWHSLTSCQ